MEVTSEAVNEVGRMLNYTGDIVFSGLFDDEEVVAEDDEGKSWGLFFVRLFSSMRDDGLGVFVEPSTFEKGKIIEDQRIFDENEDIVGFVVDEIVEGDDDENEVTLFCGVLLAVDGMIEIITLLKEKMIWPILRAKTVRCSGCGVDYGVMGGEKLCSHMAKGTKQPICTPTIDRLILTPKKILQSVREIINFGDDFPSDFIAATNIKGRIVREGDPSDNDPLITFSVTRDVGLGDIVIGDHTLMAGDRIEMPMSRARELVSWETMTSGMLVPIDHEGTMAALLSMETEDFQDDEED